jgi:Double zinc ribbon
MALTTERDWYAYLQLPPQASTRDVEQAIERLSRQASALATTAPERSQQLRETIRSIKSDLLSGPESPRRYDVPRAQDPAPLSPPATAIAPPPAPAPKHAKPAAAPVPSAPVYAAPPPAPSAPVYAAPPPVPSAPAPVYAVPPPMPSTPAGAVPPGQGTGSRLARFLRTGWTCPSCGKGAVPSEKFCTRCGTPIRPIRPEAAFEADHAPSPRPFCPSCANPLGAMDVFCSKCGARR